MERSTSPPPDGALLDTGDFSYLPDQSTLVNVGLNEQFSIMVSEWTDSISS